MRSVEEYRRSAASMLDLAQRADSVADKNRLLVMAEAWLDLAARAAKPTAAGHPPVRAERRSGALTRNSANLLPAACIHHCGRQGTRSSCSTRRSDMTTSLMSPPRAAFSELIGEKR